jgi:hypothetical protein
VVVEAADLIVVGYIVEVDYTVGIVEKKEIAGDMQQAQIVGIAVVEREFVDLELPAGGDS